MKPNAMLSRRPARVAGPVLAVIAAVAGTALAADVPWVFQGDTSRAPASSAAAASAITSFVSWTHEPDTAASPNAPFSSYPPGTILYVR